MPNHEPLTLPLDTTASRRPRLLVVGATTCPALRQTIDACGRWAQSVQGLVRYEPRLSSARLRLETGEAFDATLLLTDQPHATLADAAGNLKSAGDAGCVATVAGPWFEGRLRVQGAAGDPSIVYWHALEPWLRTALPRRGDNETQAPRTVVVASRDRDAAAAIADQLADQNLSVVWAPRGGRKPFVSRADAGVWIGGQLDGPAAAELAAFCRWFRPHGGRAVALLDFPRHDEFAAARGIGAAAVFAKPWNPDALLHAIRPAAINHVTRGVQGCSRRAA